MTYYVTFYSHYGAMHYKKYSKEKGVDVKMMPVPRDISSSCGTCVGLNTKPEVPESFHDEIELVVEKTSNGYKIIYDGR